MAIDNEALNNVQISPRYTGDSQLDKFQQDLILEVDKLKKSLNPSAPDKSTEDATPAFQVTPATAPNPVGGLGPMTSDGEIWFIRVTGAGSHEVSLPTGKPNAIWITSWNTYSGFIPLPIGKDYRYSQSGNNVNIKIYAGKLYIQTTLVDTRLLFWTYK